MFGHHADNLAKPAKAVLYLQAQNAEATAHRAYRQIHRRDRRRARFESTEIIVMDMHQFVPIATQDAVPPLQGLPELVEWLRDQAADIEAQRRLPPQVVDRLDAVGLFKLTLPPRLGGLGIAPDRAWSVILDLARGCASSAWLVSLCSANLLMLTRLSDRAQRDIFGNGERVIVSALTGAASRNVVVTPLNDGVMLSGEWSYASGVDAANWVGVLAPVGNPARMHFALVPQSSFMIDQDSWRVLGMRGTGSKNVVLPATFVPQHRLMDWSLIQQGGRHPDCSSHDPFDRYPINALFAMSILAPALGVARAVVDEFEAMMRRRADGVAQDRRDPHLMSLLAQSRAAISLACESLMGEAIRPLADLDGNASPSLRVKAEMRVRIVMIARSAFASCQQLFAAAGGQIMPTGSRFERLFRDFHAMYSHVLLQPEPIGENCGRLQLGLEALPNTRI
jgi:3-hydroxy-9,10-secoandrosta-1,3,5(10)-triene-9,17-dione monooxygenase